MATVRTRQPPPPFRRLEVARVEDRHRHLRRVTLTGPELESFDPGLPAASVRLLLPTAAGELVLPTWEGNEFLLPDGTRASIRTLTPLRFDADALELDVEVVRHDDSPLTRWVAGAEAGTPTAVSGTGRGFEVDPAVTTYVLAGDESALPAISTLVPALPVGASVTVVLAVRDPAMAAVLAAPAAVDVRATEVGLDEPAGDVLVAGVAEALPEGRPPGPEVHVWAAGEAADVQQLRKALAADDIGLPRSQTTIRGYWKRGREGT